MYPRKGGLYAFRFKEHWPKPSPIKAHVCLTCRRGLCGLQITVLECWVPLLTEWPAVSAHCSSYLHCEWATISQLEKDKRIHQKLKRFKTKMAQMRHFFHEVSRRCRRSILSFHWFCFCLVWFGFGFCWDNRVSLYHPGCQSCLPAFTSQMLVQKCTRGLPFLS